MTQWAARITIGGHASIGYRTVPATSAAAITAEPNGETSQAHAKYCHQGEVPQLLAFPSMTLVCRFTISEWKGTP